jgi:hypothetical protein
VWVKLIPSSKFILAKSALKLTKNCSCYARISRRTRWWCLQPVGACITCELEDLRIFLPWSSYLLATTMPISWLYVVLSLWYAKVRRSYIFLVCDVCFLQTNSNLIIVFHVARNFFPNCCHNFSFTDSIQALIGALYPFQPVAAILRWQWRCHGWVAVDCHRTLVSIRGASS